MKMVFRLTGLDCAHCAAKIEKEVNKLDGVEKAVVSFMTTKMTIEADEAKSAEITEKAAAIVKRIEPDVVMKRG